MEKQMKVLLNKLDLKVGKDFIRKFPKRPKDLFISEIHSIYRLGGSEDRPAIMIISLDGKKIKVGILYLATDQSVIDNGQEPKRWNWACRYADDGAFVFDEVQRQFSSPNFNLEVRVNLGGYLLVKV